MSTLRAECGCVGTFARCLPFWIYRLITVPSICFIRRVITCQICEQKKNWSKCEVTYTIFLGSVCLYKIRHISIMLAKYRQSIIVLCFHIYWPYVSTISQCLLVIEPPEHHRIVHILMMKKISHYRNVLLIIQGLWFSIH